MIKKFNKWIKTLIVVMITLTSFTVATTQTQAAETYTPVSKYTIQGTGAYVTYQGATAWWLDGIGKIEVNDDTGICIEPHILGLHGQYVEKDDIPISLLRDLELIKYYAYDVTSQTDWDYATAQFMAWERLGASIQFVGTFGNDYPALKAAAQARIDNHNLKPSFHTASYEVNLGTTLVIDDAISVLNEYHIADASGATVSIIGNSLHITPTTSTADDIRVQVERIPYEFQGASLVLSSADPNGQDVAVLRNTDPGRAWIDVHVNKYGTLSLYKDDEDGSALEGIGFAITNKDTGDVVNGTTNADGEINVDLLPGNYSAHETSTLEHLVLDETVQEFSIRSNETTTVAFTNKWIVGDADITKLDENGKVIKVAGTEYDIFDSNNNFLEHIVSDASGVAKVSQMRYSHDNYAIETKAPHGYLVDATPIPFDITQNKQTVHLTKKNKRSVGELILNKEDIETGTTPQGDASLIGAGFTLLANKDIPDPTDPSKVLIKKGSSLGEKIMDESLQVKWDNLYLSDNADNYRIVETKLPTGYLKANDILVSLNYKNDKTQVISVSKTVYEQVMKRDVHGYKFATDGSVGTINPLAGAEFTYKLKSEVNKVGWDAARAYAIATSDVKGEWWAKDLPYGTYIQKETYTPVNHISVPDMEVVVDSNDSDPIIMYLNDPIYDAYVRFAKKDLATDTNITLSNAKFKIYHEDGTIVREKNGLFYKEVFTTDENGFLELNKTLPADKYYAIEQGTLPGFLTPQVRFDFEISMDGEIIGVNAEDGKPIILVEIFNERPTVEIELTKLFETYDANPNKEALFELRVRDEEISPVDGSVMYEEGEVLLNPNRPDGLWSIKDGETLTIDSLYFGIDDELVILAEEKSTSPEYVPHCEILEFVVTKEDDTTKVYTSSQALENKLKRTDLVVNKIDEYTRGKLEDYSNIELTLYKDADLTEVYASTFVNPLTGQAVFKDIVYGSHLFLGETSTNSKYYLNGQIIELVFDNDLEGIGEVHSMDYTNRPVPTMTTLASGINDKKTLDRNVDNELFDEMTMTNMDISETYDIYSEFIEYETGEVVLSSSVMDVEFEEKDVVYTISQTAKAHTLDANRYYYRQRVFLAGSDPEVDTPIVEHDDAEDLNQTIHFTTSKIGTLATGEDAVKVLDPTVDNPVKDEISYEDIDIDKTYVVKTLGVSDQTTSLVEELAGKDYKDLSKKEAQSYTREVLEAHPELVLVSRIQNGVSFTSPTGTHLVEFIILANTLKDGEGIVFLEYFYDEDTYIPEEKLTPGEENIPVVDHEDLLDEGQTIRFISTQYEILVNKVDSISLLPIISKDFEFTAEFYKDGVLVDTQVNHGDKESGIATFLFKGTGSFDEIHIYESNEPLGFLRSDEVKIITMKDFDQDSVYSFIYLNSPIPSDVVTGIPTYTPIWMGIGILSLGVIVYGTYKKKSKAAKK